MDLQELSASLRQSAVSHEIQFVDVRTGVYFCYDRHMKILFVCHGNVARSQMAEMIYNKLTESNDADSAGTHAEKPGETLGQRKKRIGKSFVVDVMKDNNMSVENKKQTQVTKSMLEKYDLVIGMGAKRYTPKWLADSPNYIYWKIRDPKAQGYSTTNNTRLSIERKIKELIAKY